MSESVIKISVACGIAEVIASHAYGGDGADSWMFEDMSADMLEGIGEMFILAAKIAKDDDKKSHGLGAELCYSIEVES